MRHVTHGGKPILALVCAMFLGLAAPAAAADADFDAGLSAFLDGDYRYAREIWQGLAEVGDANSQFGLGMNHESWRGVPPAAEKAFHWYSPAAEQGMIEAQFSLGVLYQHGRGIARDPELAAELYFSAAERGNAQAQYNLGALYLGGEGIAPDRDLGIAWLRRPAAQRFGRAIQRLKIMGVVLHPSDEEARKVTGAAPERAAPETPPDNGRREQLLILVDSNQFEVPLDQIDEDGGDSGYSQPAAAPAGD